jgi:hypothetical protein
MSSTGDDAVIPSAPEPQRPAQSLARAQVRVASEAGGHERPQSRWCKGRHTPLSSAGPTPMPAVGGPGSRRAIRVRIPGSSSPLGSPPDSLSWAPQSALQRLRRLLTSRSRLSAQDRPDPRLTPPLTPTTLDPDHQLRLSVRREPWTPTDSKRSCDPSRWSPRGAPRAASCPVRRLSVSSVSAPGQRRRAGGTIPVAVRTPRRHAASASAAVTAPASMSYARRGTAARAPPPAPTARNALEEVAVSRRRLTLVVPVPPRAAPAVHRRPTGRREPPHPAAEISRHARAGSARAPDSARSLPDVRLHACPRALPGRTRHLARWGS